MDGPAQNYISMPQQCSFKNATTVHLVSHDNHVFAPNADAAVSGCGGKLSFEDWLKLGVDSGSTISTLPSNEKVIQMGMAVLGI